MRMMLLASVAAGMLAMTSFNPVQAFPSGQGALAAGQAGQGDVLLVKRSKAKPRPPGWNRGNAAWKRGGRGVPPGQR